MLDLSVNVGKLLLVRKSPPLKVVKGYIYKLRKVDVKSLTARQLTYINNNINKWSSVNNNKNKIKSNITEIVSYSHNIIINIEKTYSNQFQS